MAAAALARMNDGSLEALDLSKIAWKDGIFEEQGRRGEYFPGSNEVHLDSDYNINSLGELADEYSEELPAGESGRSYTSTRLINPFETLTHELGHGFDDEVASPSLLRLLTDLPGGYEPLLWQAIQRFNDPAYEADAFYNASQNTNAEPNEVARGINMDRAESFAGQAGIPVEDLPTRHQDRVDEALRYLSKILGEN